MRNSSVSPKQAEVLARLVAGDSVSNAAAATGLHRTTIHHWCRTSPEFRIALEDAKTARAEAIYDQIGDISPLAVITLKAILENEQTAAHLRLKAALAILRPALAPQRIHHNSSEFITNTESEETSGASIPRNAPCPCGSREKYKRCCGRSAPPVLTHAA